MKTELDSFLVSFVQGDHSVLVPLHDWLEEQGDERAEKLRPYCDLFAQPFKPAHCYHCLSEYAGFPAIGQFRAKNDRVYCMVCKEWGPNITEIHSVNAVRHLFNLSPLPFLEPKLPIFVKEEITHQLGVHEFEFIGHRAEYLQSNDRISVWVCHYHPTNPIHMYDPIFDWDQASHDIHQVELRLFAFRCNQERTAWRAGRCDGCQKILWAGPIPSRFREGSHYAHSG